MQSTHDTTSRSVKLVIKYNFHNGNDTMPLFRILKMNYSPGSAMRCLHGVAGTVGHCNGARAGKDKGPSKRNSYNGWRTLCLSPKPLQTNLSTLLVLSFVAL